MNLNTERRNDLELRAIIDQAVEFKRSIGTAGAVSFLVEHHVPPPLLQRVLMQANAAQSPE